MKLARFMPSIGNLKHPSSFLTFIRMGGDWVNVIRVLYTQYIYISSAQEWVFPSNKHQVHDKSNWPHRET